LLSDSKTLKNNAFLTLIGLLVLFSAAANAHSETKPEMKTYTFVMLTKSLNRAHESEEVKQIQAGDMAHIGMMAEKHGLDLAGPFLDDGFRRGILVFNTSDTAKVRSLVEQDPAVVAGRLTF
jgi:uncharacterized protein YciI